MHHHRSSISLSKLLFSRYPLQRSPIPKSPIPIPHRLLTGPPPKSPAHFAIFRQYSAETDRAVDEINLKFAEAREEIETAMDSKETVYFNEEAECARDAVKEVLDLYEGLFQSLPEKERGVIQRSMGLKIEQLKAELDQLNE